MATKDNDGFEVGGFDPKDANDDMNATPFPDDAPPEEDGWCLDEIPDYDPQIVDFSDAILDIPYPRPLAIELVPFHAYVVGFGHCLRVIPRDSYPRALSEGDFSKYEQMLPVRFVLSRSFRIRGSHLMINEPCDPDVGLILDDEYEIYQEMDTDIEELEEF